MARFYPLEKLINLHDDYSGRFKIDSLELLLIQRRGERYLLEGRCPHRGHSLEHAELENDVIECALHRYQFNIHSGHLVLATEQACRNLRTFELVYEGNEVGVVLDDA
ncbi:MAG: Rieske (2Fe-2S) protein [Pseudomonadota bacterium]